MKSMQEVSYLWYKTSNRKPYLRLKDSMVNFFNSHVRFIHESNTIESQFEKPYLDGEYPTMHLRRNVPTLAGGSRKRRQGGMCIQVRSLTCRVHCSSIDDCVVRCSIVRGSIGSHAKNLNWSPFGGSISKRNDRNSYIEIKHECASTCTEPFEVGASASWVEPLFCSGGYEPKGCDGSYTVPCDPCLDPEEMVWTAGDTIVRVAGDENMPLTFTGGVGPFTWEASGTGAVLSITGLTYSRENILNLDGTGCGVITITITDYCDSELTHDIRVTNVGQWHCYSHCRKDHVGGYGNVYEEIIGVYKYKDFWCGYYTSSGNDCSTPYWCENTDGCDTPQAPGQPPNVTWCLCFDSSCWLWQCFGESTDCDGFCYGEGDYPTECYP